MSLQELYRKRDLTIIQLNSTTSWKAKRDLTKYLNRLNQEIGKARKSGATR